MKKYFFFVLLFLLSAVFGETIQLNLSETTVRAIRESEDYQMQKNEVVKSEYKTKETTSILFPQITGELAYFDNIKYPNIATTRFMKNFNFDAGVSVNQIITTFGKLSASINAMKKFTSMNKHFEDKVKDEAIFNGKLLYFNAYFAQKVLQITKESYENTLKNKV
jgi:outer membrane protein TolC